MTATERADAPYTDGRERLLDELHRVDLLLRRHLQTWWRERETGEGDLRGLFVSDAEVDRLLSTADERGSPDTEGRRDRDLERAIASAGDRIDIRQERADARTPLARLASEYDLDRDDLDALLLALAPDFDRKYEKVYGYLQDDVTRTRPSVGLLVRILAADEESALEGRARFQRGATLVDEGLVTVAAEGDTLLSRPVSVPERVASFLVGSDSLPACLADVATVVEPTGGLDAMELSDAQQTELASLRDRLGNDGAIPPLSALVGPASETATTAISAVVPTGGTIIRLDAGVLQGSGSPNVVAALRREGRLRDAAVHVQNVTPSPDRDDEEKQQRGRTLPELLGALDRIPAPVFVTGDVDIRPDLAPELDQHDLTVVEMAVPTRDRRADIWRDQPLPDGVAAEGLADAFRLTHGEITDAVATARSIADGDPDADVVREACRSIAGRGLKEHAREIDPGYDWADIVLPPDTEAKLREAAAQVRHRGTVFESWGFADRYSQDNGVALLFTGPSGTGKTMAAEVIAEDVGLPLFAIDLATMLSKYVGETEENLKQVFDAAERTNAILFFDEADALFGKRSKVSDAHDRYANVEIDYLLQRLEAHDGPVILASNLAENIDEAFRRRINITVEFPHPDRAAREEIWRGAFPEATPTGELDWEYLSAFDLTGGNITNVATTAAFMAAEDETAVDMCHLVRALRRELQKEGRLIDREDFAPYEEAIS